MRLLIFAAAAVTLAHGRPAASLRFDTGRATFAIEVADATAASAYKVHITCTAGCPRPLTYSEDGPGDPMGLFSRDDRDGLVYSLWSGGSAYAVVVWRLDAGGVSRVAELRSRGRPSFLSDAQGRPVIITYGGGSGVTPWKAVRWTYWSGRFRSR